MAPVCCPCSADVFVVVLDILLLCCVRILAGFQPFHVLLCVLSHLWLWMLSLGDWNADDRISLHHSTLHATFLFITLHFMPHFSSSLDTSCNISLHHSTLHATFLFITRHFMQHFSSSLDTSCHISLHHLTLHATFLFITRHFMSHFSSSLDTSCHISLHHSTLHATFLFIT